MRNSPGVAGSPLGRADHHGAFVLIQTVIGSKRFVMFRRNSIQADFGEWTKLRIAQYWWSNLIFSKDLFSSRPTANRHLTLRENTKIAWETVLKQLGTRVLLKGGIDSG